MKSQENQNTCLDFLVTCKNNDKEAKALASQSVSSNNTKKEKPLTDKVIHGKRKSYVVKQVGINDNDDGKDVKKMEEKHYTQCSY